MPTRVVLNESPAGILSPPGSPSSSPQNPYSSLPSTSRAAPRFSSGFLRSVVAHDDEEQEEQQGGVQISSTDIRASPRLSGYLYILLSSVVNLASVAQFYKNEEFDINYFLGTGRGGTEQNDPTESPVKDWDDLILVSGTLVYKWKFVGAFVVAVIGTSSSLFIILVHFDSVCCPQFWRKFFMDGSVQERNLIVLSMVFWSIGVHVCTSSFSIGSTQANVYFTSWIALIGAFMNYDLWRAGAGKAGILDFVSQQRQTTTFNWFWTCLFAVVTAGAATDIYFNREHYVFYQDGEVVQVQSNQLYRMLAITWVWVLTSIICIFAKFYWTHWKIWKLKWYMIEGLILVAAIGVLAWATTTFTGVQATINGPANAYFGLWGSFFSSLLTFGTWIRENDAARKIMRRSSAASSSAV